MLGYKHEEIGKHSWVSEEDEHKFYQFITLLQEDAQNHKAES